MRHAGGKGVETVMAKSAGYVFWAVCLWLVTAAAAQAALVQSIHSGQLDWTRAEVSATAGEDVAAGWDPASDQAVAVRKAATAARRALLEVLAGVRLDSSRKVADLFKADAGLEGRVRLRLQNSRLDEPQTVERRVEARALAGLAGPLCDLVLPLSGVAYQSGLAPRLAGAQAPEARPEALRGNTSFPEYTGLVIDARGLKVEPALLPVVFDAVGVGVYGAFLVPRAAIAEKMLVLYDVEMSSAAVAARVGAKPLAVKAVSAVQACDLVIPAADAESVRALLKIPGLAARCPVAVILDQTDAALHEPQQP